MYHQERMIYMVAESFVPNEGQAGANPGVDPGAGGAAATNQLDAFNANSSGSILERASQSFGQSGVLGSLDGKGQFVKYPEDLEGSTEYSNFLMFKIFQRQSLNLQTQYERLKESLSGAVESATSLITGDSAAEGQSIADAASSVGQGILDANLGEQGLAGFNKTIADTRLAKAKTDSKDVIVLGMNTGLQLNDNLSYTENNFGAVKGILEGNMLATFFPKAVAGGLGAVDTVGKVVGADLNSEQAFNSIIGAVSNPRKEMTFEGVQIRTYDMSFNFSPRSRTEAEAALQVVRMFRFHAYPEVSPNRAFYSFPSEFEIHPFIVRNGVSRENTKLPKFPRAYLTSVSTNYTPNDYMTSFEDGTPTQLTLSLSFQEAEALSRNHIKAGF